MLDKQMAYYYYAHGIEPPVSEIQRLMGRTRLGSLLQMIDSGRRESPFDSLEMRIDVTRGYLRDLREAAAAQDTALLVLLIPPPYDVAPPTSRRYVLHEFNRLLHHPLPMAGEGYQNAAQIMDELGIPYLNPIHALDVELDYPPDDFHWNSAGHQKIGGILSDCIGVFEISGDLSDCEEVTMPEPR